MSPQVCLPPAREAGLHRFLLAALILAATCRAGAAGEPGVQIIQGTSLLTITINGRLFTEYHYQDAAQPYYYPLLGPGQLPMTRDWPMKPTDNEEHDHPHQRSLWFSHGAVNGIDFWTTNGNAGKIIHDGFTEISSGPDSGVIRSRDKWVARGVVVCTDDRVMRVYNPPDGSRLFDFEVTIHASAGDVTFGDSKEGMMGMRLAETMRLMQPQNKPGLGHIINSAGNRDAAAWGKHADWVDYDGPVQDKIVGVAVFDNPDNLRHPTGWHARDYGLLAANPFALHDFEGKPVGSGDYKLPAGQSLTFRYRFYLHTGDDQQAAVAAHYADYAKTAAAK